MPAPRLGGVALVLVVLGGVGTSLGVTSMGPAAASPNAVPAMRSGGVQTVPGTSDLSGVACATSSSCFAVGSENEEGVVVPIDDGVPGPPQVVSGTDNLQSVTCISAQSCIAVGTGPFTFPPEPTTTAGKVVAIDNGQASIEAVVAGMGLPGAPDRVYLNSVACSDATHCLGAGRAAYEGGFVDGGGQGGLQGLVQSISPLGMSGVECVQNDNDWCLADGQTPGEKRENQIFGMARFVQIGGSKGRLGFGPEVVFPRNTDLYGGACHAHDLEFCLIAGVHGNQPAEGAVFSVVGESSGVTRDVPGTNALNDLACSGNYWCVAVGSNTAGGGAIVPVGWETPGAMRPVTGIDGFSGVSCPTPQSCVGVGSVGPTGAMDTFPIWG